MPPSESSRKARRSSGTIWVKVVTMLCGSLSGGAYGLTVGIGVSLMEASMLPGTR